MAAENVILDVVLDQGPLGLDDVVVVARKGAAVRVDPAVSERLRRGRAVVDRHERENRPVYGLTRGLGGQVVNDVPVQERADFSRIVVLARASGGGAPLPREAVRATLFARAAGLSRGGAGVRSVLLERLLAMLNAGVHPLIPSVGSVGASDLALMANAALPLIGEGRAEFDGVTMAGAEAMRRAGLAPLELQSKEGLALCSANAVSTGLGALVLRDALDLADLLDGIAVLTFEAFRANPSPLDERVAAARPAPGQVEAAARLRGLLAGSALFEAGEPRRLQDPISLRCASQVHGALRSTIAFARAPIDIELNGAGDNPLVLAEAEEILSNGNFHTPATAIAFDALALALHQSASLSARRARRLLDGSLTGLPDRLTRHGMTRLGAALLSATADTLSREVRRLTAPASADDTEVHPVEDHSPMTLSAVRKAGEIVALMRQIVSCELIVASQALELRSPAAICPAARRLFEALREVVPALDEDRSQTEDLERATALVASGRLNALLREAV